MRTHMEGENIGCSYNGRSSKTCISVKIIGNALCTNISTRKTESLNIISNIHCLNISTIKTCISTIISSTYNGRRINGKHAKTCISIETTKNMPCMNISTGKIKLVGLLIRGEKNNYWAKSMITNEEAKQRHIFVNCSKISIIIQMILPHHHQGGSNLWQPAAYQILLNIKWIKLWENGRKWWTSTFVMSLNDKVARSTFQISDTS